MPRFAVVQSDGKTIETHATRERAEWAAQVLNDHEATCAARRAEGDPNALAADRPGRPFTYTVREEN